MASSISGSILKPAQLDPSKLTFGSVKALDNGGKLVYANYNKEALRLQTPEMVMPLNMGRWPGNGPDAPEKFDINLSFQDMHDRPSVRTFYDVISRLDDHMRQAGMDNSPAWLKKKVTSLDVVDAMYTPMIKVHKENGEPTDKYPPNFKVNLPYRDGKFGCDVFDEQRQPLDLFECGDLRGARVTAIIQLSSVWIAGGKFGCSWKAVQLRVVPKVSIKGYAFQEDDDRVKPESDIEEDGGAAPTRKTPAVDLAPPKQQQKQPQPDSEEEDGGDGADAGMEAKAKPTAVDDDEDDDEVLPPPPPPAATRKKTASKA